MILPIKMKNPEDVTRLSNTIAETGIHMAVHCGNVMVDARSILALFTLIGKDAILVAPDDTNPKFFSKLVHKLGVAV